VLQNLEAFARARELPRLALHALAERVRIHAQRSRVETAAQLLAGSAAGARASTSTTAAAAAAGRAWCRRWRARRWRWRAPTRQARCASWRPRRPWPRTSAAWRVLTVRALRAVLLAARGNQDATAAAGRGRGLAEIGGCSACCSMRIRKSRACWARCRGRATMPRPAWATRRPVPKLVPAHAGALLTPKEAHILTLLATGCRTS
jgi:LuxR family maltose regulon positive regulatory protein